MMKISPGEKNVHPEMTSYLMKSVQLTDRDFNRLQSLIRMHCGINMTPNKKTLVQTRLQKRLRVLGIDSIKTYCEYLFSKEGFEHELIHMIDVITTNKTDFFREPAHFDIMVRRLLPEMIENGDWSAHRPLKIWSAGCATGEEAYTLAMILHEFSQNHHSLPFSIFATDISTKALREANLGIYHYEKIEPVPKEMKKKYLLQSKDKSSRLVRIIPELRRYVQFGRLNFMEKEYSIRERNNIIFLRNVLIYFERVSHEIILNRLSNYLIKEGYLFIGHAETLHGLNVPFQQAFPAVYKK